eukprot:1047664-Rhodomonas_salina.2
MGNRDGVPDERNYAKNTAEHLAAHLKATGGSHPRSAMHVCCTFAVRCSQLTEMMALPGSTSPASPPSPTATSTSATPRSTMT